MFSIIRNLKTKIHQFLTNCFAHARIPPEHLLDPTMPFFAKLFIFICAKDIPIHIRSTAFSMCTLQCCRNCTKNHVSYFSRVKLILITKENYRKRIRCIDFCTKSCIFTSKCFVRVVQFLNSSLELFKIIPKRIIYLIDLILSFLASTFSLQALSFLTTKPIRKNGIIHTIPSIEPVNLL